MYSFFVEKRLNKDNKPYYCLVADLGYKEVILTFKVEVICNLLDVTERSLIEKLNNTSKILVTEFDIKEI